MLLACKKPARSLQWGRLPCCPHSGLRSHGGAARVILSNCVPYDTVPKAVVQATCEMARELLIVDRTASPPGEGVDTVTTAHATHAATGTASDSTSSSTKYSKVDTRRVISPVARAMLSKFGAAVSGGSGAVMLVRA